MKRAYRKIIGRSVRKSVGRFMSIFAITALGVGFLAGLMSATPDMKYSIDRYYDESNFYDIFLKSTAGFTDDDVAAIEQEERIGAASGVYVMDASMEGADGDSYTSRLTGVDFASMEADPGEDSSGAFNRLELTSGEWPKNDGECVVEYTKPGTDTLQIGDTLTVSEENDDADDTYRTTTFTITGFVENPAYFSLEDESTTVGTGKIKLLIYVPETAFALDYYTEIQASVVGAAACDTFTDAYEETVDAATEALETLADRREQVRYDEIVEEGEKELQKKEEEYQEEKTETLKSLSDAEAKLQDAAREIEEGEAEYADGKKELEANEKKLAEGEKELESGKKEIEEGEAELKKGKQKLAKAKKELEASEKTAKPQIESGKKKLAAAKTELEAQEEELSAAKQKLDASAEAIEKAKAALAAGGLDAATEQTLKAQVAEYEAGLASYTEGYTKLEQAKKELEQEEEKLAASEKQLSDAEKKLAASEKKLAANEKKLAKAKQKIKTSEKEIEDGKKELEEGKKKLQEAKEQLESAKAEVEEGKQELQRNREKAEKAFKKAEKKLDKARKQVENPDEVTWYVLDRNSNVSYASFKANVDKVASIAKVFPVFFFLIAALVVLTTMTRMVEEERTEIGTLKALGYGNATIVSKYVIYAAAAAALGVAVGIQIGTRLFPLVIWNAYSIMYTFPELIYLQDPLICVGTSAALVASVLGATVYASLGSLKESPAALMLPKAPKAGKRVFLEYIGPLWRRMRFTHKVTARNLLRYKKRFFMTVLGVAGCTALLVTGFGFRDSIRDIVERQYGTLQKYDLEIQTDEEVPVDDPDEESALLDYLRDDTRQDGWIRMHKSNAEMTFGGETADITLTVPEDTERMKDFRVLQVRESGEDVPFDGDSVILSEKVAERMGITAGDTVSVKNSDDQTADFTVTGVVENYIVSYIFIGRDAYEAAYEAEPEYLCVDIISRTSDPDEREALSVELLEDASIESIQFSADNRETFSDMLGKVDYIVVVLIVCAGLLAFIVLYDLTNINVSERKKEIATIKVLGFYDAEVSAYIYRETLVLSVLGTLAGLVLGIFLHAFVVRTAELDAIMFGRHIYPLSFVLSAVVTMLFSLIVNLVMGRRMRRIDMAESMKAVD